MTSSAAPATSTAEEVAIAAMPPAGAATVVPVRSPQSYIDEALAKGLDPDPTPIGLRKLRHWLLLSYRAERRYYRKLGRGRKLTSDRLRASVFPSLDRPIFVLGAARSGTTFLGDCMGRLPEVSYHHEPPATKAAGRYVSEGLWSERRSRMFFRFVYATLLRMEVDGDLRFADKTPTNALLLPFLDRTFKGAQFIHIIRDGRDAAASHFKKPWLRADAAPTGTREPGGYLHGPWAPWWVERDRRAEFAATSDVHRMIWAWRRYTEQALHDGPPLGPEHYLEVRYESLVARPRDEGERILDFLHITRPASRAPFIDALQRAEAGSVGAWQRAFGPAELAVIEADSGDLLRSLGYGA